MKAILNGVLQLSTLDGWVVEAVENDIGWIFGYQHKGEEFVYVLEGDVEITVGDHINSLGPHQSLHFNSGIRHKLKSISDEKAALLVVIYSP